ncbi:MAG: DUF1343 domain-containing protein [Desulfurococcaceae archaeon]|nr:DUF1343 domain-containing protein [Desulfurococcaceae archaeon]
MGGVVEGSLQPKASPFRAERRSGKKSRSRHQSDRDNRLEKDLATIDLGWISSWIYPSSAIPSSDNTFIYSTTVYFEGTKISKGRGTY